MGVGRGGWGCKRGLGSAGASAGAVLGGELACGRATGLMWPLAADDIKAPTQKKIGLKYARAHAPGARRRATRISNHTYYPQHRFVVSSLFFTHYPLLTRNPPSPVISETVRTSQFENRGVHGFGASTQLWPPCCSGSKVTASRPPWATTAILSSGLRASHARAAMPRRATEASSSSTSASHLSSFSGK